MWEEKHCRIIEGDDNWTTHEEKLEFLAELESRYEHAHLEIYEV